MAVLAALWGASYFFIKVALEDLSPAALVFARCALAALVLAPVAVRRGAFAPARRHLGTLVVVGLIQIAGPFLLIAIGEQEISSSLAGILVASAPIFTSILAVFVAQDERLRGVGLAGIGVGMVGVAVLLGVDVGGDSGALLGAGLVLLASIGYAAGALLAKKRLKDVPAVGVAAKISSQRWGTCSRVEPASRPAFGLSTFRGAVTPASFVTFTRNVRQPPSTSSAFAAPAATFTRLSGLIWTRKRQ